MVKTDSKNIMGKNVSVTQWAATKAIEMQVQLLTVMKGFTLDLIEIDDDAELIKMLQVAMSTAGKDFMPLVKSFLLAASIDGKATTPTQIDFEYSGDLVRMMLTFAFVAKVNYVDFFAIGREESGS